MYGKAIVFTSCRILAVLSHDSLSLIFIKYKIQPDMKLIISSREEWESRNSDFRLTGEITVRRVQTETVTGQRLLACAGRNSPRHR